MLVINHLKWLPAIGRNHAKWKVQLKTTNMLHWTITFLILALVAGLLGFTTIAGASFGIAKVLFVVFLVLLLVSFFSNALRGKAP